MTLLAGDILRLAARRAPARIAVIDGARTMDFATLDREADRLANALHARGVTKGVHVGVISSNRLEYAIINFAVARTGAVLCHLSYRSTAEDVAFALDKVRAEAVLVERAFAPAVAAARDRVRSLRHVVVFGDEADHALAAFTAGRPAEPPSVRLVPDDPLCITFTGGTTGFPKAVVATHRARGLTAFAAAYEFGIDDSDVMIQPAPLFHTAGMCIWFHPAILIGATSVMLRRWDVAAFIDLVERHRVTALFMVPTQLGDLVRHPDFTPARLASVRKIGYAAAPMPPALFDELRRILPAVAFTENYGSTEGGLMTVRPPRLAVEKAGSVGRPVIGHELAVVDNNGTPVPDGESGFIVARGPACFSGYWEDKEETAAALHGGWLWTGDIGYRDADGFYYLVDRAKDMLILGGENVYPKEIENALYRHPAVAECAVFGVPDERLGEVPAAHVVLRPGATVTEAGLIEFCAAAVARHKRPRLVRFVDALPKTTVGKIQKNVIRAAYWPDATSAR